MARASTQARERRRARSITGGNFAAAGEEEDNDDEEEEEDGEMSRRAVGAPGHARHTTTPQLAFLLSAPPRAGAPGFGDGSADSDRDSRAKLREVQAMLSERLARAAGASQPLEEATQGGGTR